MGSRLDRITDWRRVARSAGYHVDRLANSVGVTERQLQRYFHSRFSQTPKVWLDRLRMADGQRDLRRGMMIKEVAERLRFKHTQGFTRAFGRVHGTAPSNSRSSRSCAPKNGTANKRS